MNSPSNAMNESQTATQPVAAAATSPTRPLYWSIRRELWENRFIYLVPLAAGALFVFGYLISLTRMRTYIRTVAWNHVTFAAPYESVAALVMGTGPSIAQPNTGHRAPSTVTSQKCSCRTVFNRRAPVRARERASSAARTTDSP